MQRAIIQTLFSLTAYSSILILIFAFYPVFDWLLQVFEKVNEDKPNEKWHKSA